MFNLFLTRLNVLGRFWHSLNIILPIDIVHLRGVQCIMVLAKVTFTKLAEKEIRKLPKEILESLLLWIERIEFEGLANVRKISGYHDEPLKGERKGQRSIRLNKAYRAIYTCSIDGKIELVTIIEVNKHKY